MTPAGPLISSSRLVNPGAAFGIACWFGLVTGLLELLFLGAKKLAFQRFIFLSPHVVWMTPLTNLTLFAGLGLLLWIGLRVYPWAGSPRNIVTACAFPSLLALLLFVPGFSSVAALILAAGLAVQAGRLASRGDQRFAATVQRTWMWLLVAVACLGTGAFGLDWIAARPAMAAAPPAGAPNVLLIVLDTVRASSLSLYGNSRLTTPRLQEWSTSGVWFEWAFATAPWTTPSHASMFTGRFPYELEVAGARPGHQEYPVLDESFPTLAEILRARGYVTAGFVANVEYAGYETGLNRGFGRYEDYAVTPQEFPYTTALGRSLVKNLTLRRLTRFHDTLGRKTASDVNAAFLRWLAGERGRPFFAFLNYFDAHEPYLPPPPFDTSFGRPELRDTSRIVPWGVHQAKRHDKVGMSADERRGELDAYEGAIAYLDHQLGLLLDTLHEQGTLDNTLLIITSDHGELFGEHELFEHGNSLYLPLLHVPLVIRFPGRVPPDGRISASVTLRDLPATVGELLDLPVSIPGDSLARLWTGSEDRLQTRDVVLAEVEGLANAYPWEPVFMGDMRSLILDRLHYIRRGDGSEELYDFEVDPHEANDLSDAPTWQGALDRFRRMISGLRVVSLGPDAR